MKKLRNKKGMTLMEMMVSILVLVLLVIGIGTGMDAGIEVYREATFEADCIALADMVNTALNDVLQYAENVKGLSGVPNIDFSFSNLEYGLWDVYFQTADGSSNTSGLVLLHSTKTNKNTPLVSTGAYPNLAVTNFTIKYVERGASDGIGAAATQTVGGYFDIKYTVFNVEDPTNKHDFVLTVRHLNAE